MLFAAFMGQTGAIAGATTHRALAPIDIAIIAVYFVIVFGIGFYFSRKERTSEDYFLASRDIGWFFVGASLFVSNISTEHFIGLSGTGASSGLAVGHFEWLACLILLLLGWVFVPFYLRSNVFTMPQFLERRFSRQCAVYLAGISIIAYIFTKISVQLYAASVVLERVAGWSLWKTAVVLVIATGIYTIAGGLAAVIYTDTVQTLILITGAVALTLIGLDKVGGIGHLRTMVPDSYFHMIKPASDAQFPWTGIFFGAPILGIWYWCTDQVIVQRVLSARDEGHAKAGTIFAGFLKILPVFMLVLPGIIAYALYPAEVAKPDFAYPTLVLNLLPVGLVGLVMAALLAAVMGAMSSVFNSASTLVTLDFYKKLRPEASEAQLVNFGRLATGGMVLLGLLWVPFIHLLSAQLYIYLQSVQAYISPPIAVCFIFGILWTRVNGQGAISSLLTGFVLGALRFVLEVLDKTRHYESGFVRWLVDMNFLHYAIFMFVVCTVVLIGVSLMYPAPDRKKLAGLTFATVDDKIDSTEVARPHLAKETRSEHMMNVAFTVVLLATVISLWIYFR
ncbi:MAG TPA: sodium:solute symporter [Candidatus Eisenbacteria bacterium]|jgi:solute:Na+ symporter, SSS family|nr:sodium:solute symporter [Candidatus Eisenbacteria bacterium]